MREFVAVSSVYCTVKSESAVSVPVTCEFIAGSRTVVCDIGARDIRVCKWFSRVYHTVKHECAASAFRGIRSLVTGEFVANSRTLIAPWNANLPCGISSHFK